MAKGNTGALCICVILRGITGIRNSLLIFHRSNIRENIAFFYQRVVHSVVDVAHVWVHQCNS